MRRERLEALLRKGKSPAQDTSVSMVYRVRKQLAEEGFEPVLSRKQRATPAVARIFDGETEANLIALACSKSNAASAFFSCPSWKRQHRDLPNNLAKRHWFYAACLSKPDSRLVAQCRLIRKGMLTGVKPLATATGRRNPREKSRRRGAAGHSVMQNLWRNADTYHAIDHSHFDLPQISGRSLHRWRFSNSNRPLSRIAQLDQRTALPDQCLHLAEVDVRPPRRKSGFDPTETLGPAPFMDAAHRAYWVCRNSIDSRHGPT
jgi:hypothetical protein